MRSTILATTLGLAVAASTLLAASPALALGTPQRPGGSIVTDYDSVNGGDNGWGNCGHNSSGGTTPGTGDRLKGNGGYKPWEKCTVDGYPSPTSTSTSTSTSTVTTTTFLYEAV